MASQFDKTSYRNGILLLFFQQHKALATAATIEGTRLHIS